MYIKLNKCFFVHVIIFKLIMCMININKRKTQKYIFIFIFKINFIINIIIFQFKLNKK